MAGHAQRNTVLQQHWQTELLWHVCFQFWRSLNSCFQLCNHYLTGSNIMILQVLSLQQQLSLAQSSHEGKTLLWTFSFAAVHQTGLFVKV